MLSLTQALPGKSNTFALPLAHIFFHLEEAVSISTMGFTTKHLEDWISVNRIEKKQDFYIDNPGLSCIC